MQAAVLHTMSRIKLFLALSRTPHGLLDMCTPLLAALLWLGHPPEPRILLLGMIAAFAGYTAVYALNDIVDYDNDKKKITQAEAFRDSGYLDGAFVRHPLAYGLLSMPEAVAWAGGWMAVSLVTAWLLNPVCALILVIGCLLEILYCLLFQISPLRTLVSGIVKTLGGLAAVLAVDPAPDPALLLLLFFWLFFWEIGGQNIPADWHDLQEDISLEAKTTPATLGPLAASRIVVVTLVTSVLLSAVLLWIAPLRMPLPLYATALCAGIYVLVLPAVRLLRTWSRADASALFNRASCYPGLLLLLALVGLAW